MGIKKAGLALLQFRLQRPSHCPSIKTSNMKPTPYVKANGITAYGYTYPRAFIVALLRIDVRNLRSFCKSQQASTNAFLYITEAHLPHIAHHNRSKIEQIGVDYVANV